MQTDESARYGGKISTKVSHIITFLDVQRFAETEKRS